MKPFKFIFIIIALYIFLFTPHFFTEITLAETNTSSPGTLTRDELANQIQDKTKQLDDLNKELESTRQALKDTQGERKTLQRELKIIENNISQLDLSIRADQIAVQKLNLEIDSLKYDIQDIQSSISDKKAAIEKILVELQRNDRGSGNLLMILLRSESLADGVLEAQALQNLQIRLTAEIGNLRNLHEEYGNKIEITSGKRASVASRERNSQNKKLIVQDQKTERQTLLGQTKNKESVFERQVAELEKLQQQIANEVEALGAVLRTKIDPALLPPIRPGVLAMPIAISKDAITQDYGATSFAKYGYKGKWHNGIDIGAPIGTAILAAEEGTVVALGDQDTYCNRGAYGKFIVVQHPNNLVTLYAHLSRQAVVKGDKIIKGQLIGYAGRTGYATGPHLHFTVFAGPTFYMGPSKVCGPMPYGGDLNPLGYL